jgi:hypothetical protein
MLRRQALCTLATAFVAAPVVASQNFFAFPTTHTGSQDLLQLLDHSLQLLRNQTGSHHATAAFTETAALLQHTRRILLAGHQGSAACWQACSDAVARSLTFLPPQSPATTSLHCLQQRLTAACRNCLSVASVG